MALCIALSLIRHSGFTPGMRLVPFSQVGCLKVGRTLAADKNREYHQPSVKNSNCTMVTAANMAVSLVKFNR